MLPRYQEEKRRASPEGCKRSGISKVTVFSGENERKEGRRAGPGIRKRAGRRVDAQAAANQEGKIEGKKGKSSSLLQRADQYDMRIQ